MITEQELSEYLRIKQSLDFSLLDYCSKYLISLNKKLKTHKFMAKSACDTLCRILQVSNLQKTDIEVTKTAIKLELCDRSDLSSEIPMEISLGVFYVPLNLLWEDLEQVAAKHYQRLLKENLVYEEEQKNILKVKEEKEHAEFERLWSKLELVK